ncbi:hypothetical protein [Wenjunlia tyrosinilytica]|uniref:Uncharacterized protein n=1 Tax=Wenjunlia tyrosinilytica TaxID=1544741 RepID=A0A917ZNA7_9ACTN|nr:hypothetical protein [Wenjunlia tyrosinilytica]GGO87273.1 hypothetical protein GCM10012280_25380 [Wenjunlia tyrosinilytica]
MRAGKTAFGAGAVALAAVVAGTVAVIGSSDSPSAKAQPRPGVPHSASPRPTGAGPSSPARPGRRANDLRRLLLPVPEGAQSEGPAELMSLDEAAIGFEPGADDALRRASFRDAAVRGFTTADQGSEVNVKLIRFTSSEGARAFAEAPHFHGPEVTVPGDARARATRLPSASAESTGALVAVSYEGNVQITISISSATPPTGARVAELLKAQYQRLRGTH